MEKEKINIGEMSFYIDGVKKFDPRPGNLRTATPIIIRIPEKNYEKYDVKIRKRRYVYWRPEISFEAFVKQLEENVFKKHREFYGEVNEVPLFEGYRFLKTTVNHLVIDGVEHKVIGSLWEFWFTGLKKDRERYRLIKFAMDCGLGERNTYGFGFVNPIRVS